MLTYSINQVAKILSLDKNTVRKLIEENKIENFQTSYGSYEVCHHHLVKYVLYENYERAISILPKEENLFVNINNFLTNLSECLYVLSSRLNFSNYCNYYDLMDFNCYIQYGDDFDVPRKEVSVCNMVTDTWEDFSREDTRMFFYKTELSNAMKFYDRIPTNDNENNIRTTFIKFPPVSSIGIEFPIEAILFAFRYYFDLFGRDKSNDLLLAHVLSTIAAMLKKFGISNTPLPESLKSIIDSKFENICAVSTLRNHIFKTGEI